LRGTVDMFLDIPRPLDQVDEMKPSCNDCMAQNFLGCQASEAPLRHPVVIHGDPDVHPISHDIS
jgi:hypothetical protein